MKCKCEKTHLICSYGKCILPAKNTGSQRRMCIFDRPKKWRWCGRHKEHGKKHE